MPDFINRATTQEMMDDLHCEGPVVDQTLRELEFINKWLGGNQVTLAALNKLLGHRPPAEELVIADLGCGGGDMLRLVYHWANHKKIKVRLVGIDANANIIHYAKKNNSALANVTFESLDILSPSFRAMRFDVVIGTLFYHHFTSEVLVQFFQQLKQQTRLGMIINDIHRHPLAYYSIKWLTASFSRSPMVISDAPLSVLRAFKRKELETILQRAGINQYSIDWKWAFRWQVVANMRTA